MKSDIESKYKPRNEWSGNLSFNETNPNKFKLRQNKNLIK